jgi:hypothetical protein
MKSKRSVKVIILSAVLLVNFLAVSQIFAKESGSTAKNAVVLDIDLRFSQRFTETQEVKKVEEDKTAAPKLVEPDLQPAPVEEPAPAPAETTPAPAEPAPAPTLVNALSILGVVIPFQNGGMANGQAIIDANPNGMASTWGGVSPFSGTDGLNTHFIGHHWGVFDPVMNLAKGGVVTVYDGNGTAFNYTIYKITVVDIYGKDVATGDSMYGEITSTGGGERIVLQTCIDETTRRIVFAS